MSTPGSVNVDWLDGRESCLIDGVRYRRAIEAGRILDGDADDVRHAADLIEQEDTKGRRRRFTDALRRMADRLDFIEADQGGGPEGAVPGGMWSKPQWAVENPTIGCDEPSYYVHESRRSAEVEASRGKFLRVVQVRILVPIDQHPYTEGET